MKNTPFQGRIEVGRFFSIALTLRNLVRNNSLFSIQSGRPTYNSQPYFSKYNYLKYLTKSPVQRGYAAISLISPQRKLNGKAQFSTGRIHGRIGFFISAYYAPLSAFLFIAEHIFWGTNGIRYLSP